MIIIDKERPDGWIDFGFGPKVLIRISPDGWASRTPEATEADFEEVLVSDPHAPLWRLLWRITTPPE